MTIEDRLASGPTATEWRPRTFDISVPDERAALDALLASGAVGRVSDTIADQVADWLKATQAGRRWTPDDLARASAEAFGELSPTAFGQWVFYPWSGVLCHVLPEGAFRFLRAARNCYKISPSEQVSLAGKTVAVAGLSVGLAAAVTLALEGVGRRFRLADFDTLGVSNLNRLRAGVPDLGVNKAVIAARQLFELDPYLHVEVFPAGVTPDTLDAFLSPPLDLLVEECDDLAMKVRLREEARRRRVPVVMDTSDRGLIDVERFDLDPDRPLLHGLIGDVRADQLAGLSAAEKVPFGLRILDAARLSVSMRATLPEVGRTVETWPQLASAVALGGALVADVSRRILLGEFAASGRFSVDPAELIRDGTAAGVIPPPVSITLRRPPPEIPDPPPRGLQRPTADEIRFVAAHAALAPSGGNSQPWRFEWHGNRLHGFVVPERTQPTVDFQLRGSYVALGAAVENVALAAAELGLMTDTAPCPDPSDPLLAWACRFERAQVLPDPLFAQVSWRVTNRKTGRRTPLGGDAREALRCAVASRGATLRLLESPAELDAVAELMGRCDRAFLLTPGGHRDTFRELRFRPAEVIESRDGLDVDALEVGAGGRAALEVLSDWRVVERLRQVGGGAALEDFAHKAVAGSSAVGLIRVAGSDPAAFVRGGRAVQRMWLTATALGLAVHPWTTLPYLLARVEAGDQGQFTDEEWGWFERLRMGYAGVCPPEAGHADVLLFRIGTADPPTVRSLRRPLSNVFRPEGGSK